MSSAAAYENLRKQAKGRLRNGDFAEARDLFCEIIQSAPNNVAAHEGLAAASFSLGDYDAAVTAFTQVSRLDPKQGRALINLGAVYNRMGNFTKAIEVLRRGIQKDRKCAQGYYNMGLAHRGLKQSAMAVSAYREAIRIDPQLAEAHQNLANTFVDMKNFQQAIRHYEKALEIKPGFERAQRGLDAVRQAVAAAQKAAKPFGRLVDTAAPTTKPAMRDSIRALTDEDRIEYRKTVAGLTTEIETAGAELLTHLKNHIEPCILTLSRTVSLGKKSAYAIGDVAAELDESVAQSDTLRSLLKKRMQDLQDCVESIRVK